MKLNCSLWTNVISFNEIKTIQEISFYKLIALLCKEIETFTAQFMCAVFFNLLILNLLISPSRKAKIS